MLFFFFCFFLKKKDILYRPAQGGFEEETFEKVISKAFETHASTPLVSGDILCFLTGQEEVYNPFSSTFFLGLL